MLDIEYIKDKVELTSIARQIVYTEILQEGMPARYNTSSKFIYIDSKFKVHSVSFKNINSIVVPTTDVSVKYEFDLDVIDFFNSTEELMLMSLLDSLGDSRIPTMDLIECIDYCKKQIYRANLKPANVLVSKTTFNALVNKLYLLPYAKVFTLPTKNISYDNLIDSCYLVWVLYDENSIPVNNGMLFCGDYIDGITGDVVTDYTDVKSDLYNFADLEKDKAAELGEEVELAAGPESL